MCFYKAVRELEVSSIQKEFPDVKVAASSATFFWYNDFRCKFSVGKEAESLHMAARMANIYHVAAKRKFDSLSDCTKSFGTMIT